LILSVAPDVDVMCALDPYGWVDSTDLRYSLVGPVPDVYQDKGYMLVANVLIKDIVLYT